MSYYRGHSTPPLLIVPPDTSFSAYLINTNGLNPTKARPLTEGSPTVKLNKIKLLKDRVVKWRLNALLITETHNLNPVKMGPLQDWHSTLSTPVGSKHGTVVVSRDPPRTPINHTNVAASQLSWEGQEIWLIAAYFPNDLEGGIPP